MKRNFVNVLALASLVTLPGVLQARDLGVLVLPVHEGKFTSSLLYEHMKLTDDFDNRGRVIFRGEAVGAVFSYGITDTVAVAIKGASIVNPRAEAQGYAWESRSGFLYGLDLLNEVFPATPGWRPGVQLSGGVTGFQVPLDRTDASGSWQTVDQQMSGVEYHGAVLATFRWLKTAPYAGMRGFGSSVTWQDHEAHPGDITGHAHGNISLVAGLPVQISKEVRFELEGRFVSETAVTAGFTIAAF